MTGPAMTEYRVTYRRTDWSENTSSKTKVFARRDALRRFLARLDGDERPVLGPVEYVVHRRTVSRWVEAAER